MVDFIMCLNQIPSGIYSLLGVIVGFALNFFKDWYANRNKLYYSLQPNGMNEGFEYWQIPDDGSSGYSLEMYNCGKNPLMIESAELVHDGKTIGPVLVGPVTIPPYQKYECELCKQDYETLRWWNKELFQVVARTVDEKEIKRPLHISIVLLPFDYDKFIPRKS